MCLRFGEFEEQVREVFAEGNVQNMETLEKVMMGSQGRVAELSQEMRQRENVRFQMTEQNAKTEFQSYEEVARRHVRDVEFALGQRCEAFLLEERNALATRTAGEERAVIEEAARTLRAREGQEMLESRLKEKGEEMNAQRQRDMEVLESQRRRYAELEEKCEFEHSLLQLSRRNFGEHESRALKNERTLHRELVAEEQLGRNYEHYGEIEQEKACLLSSEMLEIEAAKAATPRAPRYVRSGDWISDSVHDTVPRIAKEAEFIRAGKQPDVADLLRGRLDCSPRDRCVGTWRGCLGLDQRS